MDETGQVLDAKVTQSAGQGFDEAALAAVQKGSFVPASQNDVPIRATIQLSLPFEPPPLAAPAKIETPLVAVPPPPVAPPPPVQENTETTPIAARAPLLP